MADEQNDPVKKESWFSRKAILDFFSNLLSNARGASTAETKQPENTYSSTAQMMSKLTHKVVKKSDLNPSIDEEAPKSTSDSSTPTCYPSPITRNIDKLDKNEPDETHKAP